MIESSKRANPTQFILNITMKSSTIAPTAPESKSNQKIIRDLAWQVAPNLFLSFKYAWAGVTYAFATQRNFRIHTFVGIFALSMGAW